MGKIKTKDAIKGTIKQLDRAAIASDRMRRAYIQTKEKAETSTNPTEGSAEEYAASRIEGGAETVTHEAGHQIQKIGRNSFSHVKEDVTGAKQAVQNFKAVRAEQSKKGKGIKTRESQIEQAAQTETHSPSDPTGGTKSSEYHSPSSKRETVKQRSGRQEEPPKRVYEQGRKRAEQTIRTKQKLGSQKRAEAPYESPLGQENPIMRSRYAGSRSHRIVEQTDKRVKESVKSAGKKSVKTTQRAAAKTAKKSIKTAERTAKTTVKTTKEAAKAAERAAKTFPHTMQIPKIPVSNLKITLSEKLQMKKAATKAAIEKVKSVGDLTAAALKTIFATQRAFIHAMIAGGWVVISLILIICLIGLLTSSSFGIFFSGYDSGTGQTMQTAVQEINQEYQQRIEEIKEAVSYDVLEISGSQADWPEVLAIYAVKTTTDISNAQEIATMDDSKKELLKEVFWQMNQISSHTETHTTTETVETEDDEGNIVTEEVGVTETTLIITISHKTANGMAMEYGFDAGQLQQLTELLAEENSSLWNTVLYGMVNSTGDGNIVMVALSQLGNVGGQPYWSWYGFSSRVEWCACFVSWCAHECGYLEAGMIPKFASCALGMQWFQDHGQWHDNSYTPRPGDIIFFDWISNGQYGHPDHVGIVEKVENGIVYTIEGNSSDSCRRRQYLAGNSEILGYGVPEF